VRRPLQHLITLRLAQLCEDRRCHLTGIVGRRSRLGGHHPRTLGGQQLPQRQAQGPSPPVPGQDLAPSGAAEQLLDRNNFALVDQPSPDS
jgi:hypothetical protein